MEKFKLTGLCCASCGARVEKAVLSVSGVEKCSVNLLTNTMEVEGSVDINAVIKAVEKAGYGAIAQSGAQNSEPVRETKEKKDNSLRNRLISSGLILLLLAYVSMGYSMWGFPLPEIMKNNPLIIGILQLILSGIVIVINQKIIISGTKSLLRLSPNMDALITIGSLSAFLYSTVTLFEMANVTIVSSVEQANALLHGLYYDSSAMILFIITIGKTLEARAKGKTTKALESLIKLCPKTVTVLTNGKEIKIPVEKLKVGETFIVRPGEVIAVDGVVIEGHSAVNEATLTGESIPIDKEIGMEVYSGTLNQSGVLYCEATKVGADTTLSKIIEMVSNASASKAPIARIADKVSGVFIPVVMGISLITVVVWLISGANVGYALARGISVLVISCPCAMGLATPVAIMVGTGVGARNGILFKNATSLEQCGKVKTVILDKTGTITRGEPSVTNVLPAKDVTEEQLLTYAISLEQNSEHPLSKAIINYANEKGIKGDKVTDFEIFAGNGLSAKLNGKTVWGGSVKFVAEKIDLTIREEILIEDLSKNGKTPLLFALDGDYLGMIAVEDAIKEDSAEGVARLKEMGVKVVMLTGDNENTAKAIAKKVGIDQVVAGVLPDGKEKVVKGYQKYGLVAMVGDGVNDAPALTRADVGMAIGAGADVAIESAQVVLTKNSLLDVSRTIKLSRKTLKNIYENYFWALFYNSLGIPLAAGLFVSILGITFSPMLCALAMSLSDFCVVTNALRLNFINVNGKEKKLKVIKEKKITLSIKGMMCGHCEAKVKEILLSVNGVVDAKVSHEKGQAQITVNREVSTSLLVKKIEDDGYEVLEIK